MCPTCKDRLEKNPLRILDCKEEKCKKINENAPIILDYLCDDCKAHHETVKTILDGLNVKYNVNPRIVRGLDYYTKTVFEFISTSIGAQGTVCGGGRYNGLVEQVGGKPTPAVGFGMGIERLLMIKEQLASEVENNELAQVYVAKQPNIDTNLDVEIANALRQNGISCEVDLLERSFKAQFKYANKLNVKYVICLGQEELDNNMVTIKDMSNGQEEKVAVDKVVEFFVK